MELSKELVDHHFANMFGSYSTTRRPDERSDTVGLESVIKNFWLWDPYVELDQDITLVRSFIP
jgi:hypothetical protein